MVMDWLDYYGEKVVRINGDERIYSFHYADNNGVYFQNGINGNIINLLDFSSCWWRKSGLRVPESYVDWDQTVNSIDSSRLNHISGLVTGFHKQELKILHEYILNTIYKSIPINLGSPIFDLNRLKTLEVARKQGLNVPPFKVVRNSSQLKDFAAHNDLTITKSIGNGLYNVIGSERYFSYTELLPQTFIECDEQIDFFPSLLMPYIEKKYEIRSFYIDGKFFSMAILSQTSDQSKIDYRKKPPTEQIPFKLPPVIEQSLKGIFVELGLNTGSADLIVTPKNEYYFLEINPVGQFGMTSIPCNYNIEKTIAKFLINGRI